jgi:hypothetical protein
VSNATQRHRQRSANATQMNLVNSDATEILAFIVELF